MKKSDISSLTNKAVKIFLSGAFMVSTAFTLTGCDSKEKEPTDEIVEEERELTPLEQEISELEDYQFTDKIYSNEDLEPFNKIQGYLYESRTGLHESNESIELFPPEEKAEHEFPGMEYVFIGTVVSPTYYYYSIQYGEWIKLYSYRMYNDNDVSYLGVGEENKFISDEELDEIFEYRETSMQKKIQLPTKIK